MNISGGKDQQADARAKQMQNNKKNARRKASSSKLIYSSIKAEFNFSVFLYEFMVLYDDISYIHTFKEMFVSIHIDMYIYHACLINIDLYLTSVLATLHVSIDVAMV